MMILAIWFLMMIAGILLAAGRKYAAAGRIRAFQRQEGSGSQTALQSLMGEIPLVQAPTEDVADLMSGIIKNVAVYKNYRGAKKKRGMCPYIRKVRGKWQ